MQLARKKLTNEAEQRYDLPHFVTPEKKKLRFNENDERMGISPTIGKFIDDKLGKARKRIRRQLNVDEPATSTESIDNAQYLEGYNILLFGKLYAKQNQISDDIKKRGGKVISRQEFIDKSSIKDILVVLGSCDAGKGKAVLRKIEDNSVPTIKSEWLRTMKEKNAFIPYEDYQIKSRTNKRMKRSSDTETEVTGPPSKRIV